jgi:hypothetical protein
MKRQHLYWIIGIFLFLAVVAAFYLSFDLRMIGLWLLYGFFCLIGTCIFYPFFGIWIQNKYLKYTLSILTAGLIIFFVIMDKHQDVVRMREDVIYVHPKEKDIYDGSKNDPNLKPDTTKN